LQREALRLLTERELITYTIVEPTGDGQVPLVSGSEAKLAHSLDERRPYERLIHDPIPFLYSHNLYAVYSFHPKPDNYVNVMFAEFVF